MNIKKNKPNANNGVTPLIVKEISYKETWPLRAQVLRPKSQMDEMFFEFDDHSESLHLGLYKLEKLSGILSLSPQDKQGLHNKESFRLRGMAIHPSLQGQGLGRYLLVEALNRLKARRNLASQVWCNARVNALEFYQKIGFERKGEAFMIAGIGAHYLCDFDLNKRNTSHKK